MKRQILQSLSAELQPFAADLLSGCYWYKVGFIRDDTLEIRGKETELDITRFLLLRVMVADDGSEIHVPNIFIPPFLPGRGHGRSIISAIYRVAERFRVPLYLVDLTVWSCNYFIRQGAEPIDNDSVQITDRYISKNAADEEER